jgi:hypothetical protein
VLACHSYRSTTEGRMHAGRHAATKATSVVIVNGLTGLLGRLISILEEPVRQECLRLLQPNPPEPTALALPSRAHEKRR